MDKKYIKKLSFPVLNGKYTEKYVASVQNISVNKKAGLVLFVYCNIKHVGYVNYCKVSVSDNEVYTCYADGKISSKSIGEICYYKNINVINDESLIFDYLDLRTSRIEGYNAWQMIDLYQTRLKYVHKKEQEKEKIKKERAAIEPNMKLFKKINKQQFINRSKKLIFKDASYLFFFKDAETAYCNICNQDVSINKKMKHNECVICPNCKTEAVAKDICRGHKKLCHVKWSVKYEQREGKLLTRYFRCIWDLSNNYRNQDIEIRELIRVVNDSTSTINYSYNKSKYSDIWYWGNYIEEKGFMGREPSVYVRPKSTILYNTYAELQKIVKNTEYKYSGLVEFTETYLGPNRESRYRPYILDFYLSFWRKHKNVELLAKVGFSNIIMNEMDSSFHIVNSILKWDGSLYEMLGIKKYQFKWLLEKKNPSPTDVIILRKYPDISEKDYKLLTSIEDYRSKYADFMKAKKYTTLHKCNRYLESQKSNIVTYLDYLEMTEYLHYDMKKDFNIFPKNLKQMHELRIAEKKAIKDKLEAEALATYNQRLEEYAKINKQELERGNFMDVQNTKFLILGDLFIRLPYNADEIKKEGEALHHCVGNYINKVTSGETEIFFIRRKSEPDKPFYTLEWKNNQVRQCYGMKNCDKTPEVSAFVNTFTQLMTANTSAA